LSSSTSAFCPKIEEEEEEEEEDYVN